MKRRQMLAAIAAAAAAPAALAAEASGAPKKVWLKVPKAGMGKGCTWISRRTAPE